MAIKAIINNTEKEIEQIKNSDEQDVDYVYSRIGDTEVEGELPISIKSIGGELADYRIYGNTAGGESVGNLETAGEHAGEYKVPVTVEGKNLLNPNLTRFAYAINGASYFTPYENGAVYLIPIKNNTAYTIKAYSSETMPLLRLGLYNKSSPISGGYVTNLQEVSQTTSPSLTIINTTYKYLVAQISAAYFNEYGFNNLMLNEGSTALPYEPYHAPVTTPIYLPEPIKMVGDEAEYIDYAEQKMHRVRKNLLQNTATSQTINGVTFTVNEDGSVTCNGTATDVAECRLAFKFSLPAGNYCLTGIPPSGSASSYYLRAWYNSSGSIVWINNYGNGSNFTLTDTTKMYSSIVVWSGKVLNNITFYPMIRKADIEDDTYEPYIENTEVDVTLPALPTIKGTNTFSVNTSIQPSNIYIKDSFDYKKVFTATRTIEGESPLNYRSIEDNDSALKNYRIYGNTETKTRSYSGSAPLNFPIVDGSVSNYRIHGNTENGESVGGLVTDSQSEHYGKYAIPITNNSETSNIYLDEPLRKVGDEAEYIDYAEQKQHRVRKNLANNKHTRSDVNYTITENDNYIHVVGTNTTSDTQGIILSNFVDLEAGEYDLVNNSSAIINVDYYDENGIAKYFNVPSNSIKTFTYPSNVTRALNVYKAIAAGHSIDAYFQVMIVKHGNDTTIYEPYIKNTDLDVTLPALPSQSSTNSLSVGTAVQPSSLAVDVDEVVSCGDRTGNLFDLNTWANTIRNINGNGLMSISGNTISITSVNSTDCFTMPYVDSQIGVYKIPVKPNTIYTVNWYGSKYRILLFKNGTLDRIYTYDTSDNLRSFTTDSDATFITIRFGVKPTNPVGTTATISDFMISEGSTALPYEPYGYRVPVTTERSVPHTATLQLHDCLPSTMQFNAPGALYYAENGLTAGTYNFTIQDSYDTSYGGGKTYQFTLANDVPAKGQLVFGWAYGTQASAAKITSYASSTSTTAIEQVGVTEGSGGTSLGTTDGNSTNVNCINRARYGSNNYKESAIRQFLNSSAVAGSVWTPQTKYDRPPSWNSNTAGFMKDIDSDFLAVLGASPKVVALDTVSDGGGSVTINNDKFFLLSRSEVYGGKENNINEGEPYPYYSNYSNLSAADADDDNNRVKYRSGASQVVWWLRSPNSAYGYVRSASTSGDLYSVNLKDYSYGVAPACNIALDEDYKFNGQVLHVRDQISVTKGNQTLVFDVIGIDHDEVHFNKTTTNIYLPEQIKMVGNEAEYVDFGEQKQYFADGTSTDVLLPALPTISGTNTLTVETEVQPSEVYIKGKIKEIN